jgi:hypothetical protein
MIAKPVVTVLLGCMACGSVAVRAEPVSGAAMQLGISPKVVQAISTNSAAPLASQFAFTLACPGEQDGYLVAPTSTWFNFSRLDWELRLSPEAPTNVQVLVFMKDWDYLWYQQLLPGYAVPGATNHYRVDLAPTAADWHPLGHHATWNSRALMAPKEVGIRVFCEGPGIVAGTIDHISAAPRLSDMPPPFVRDVRPSAVQVACYEKFELTFDLPDRYANPFDPEEISVTATIEMPGGKTASIDGFFSRHYYRQLKPTGEEILPQGPPHWKIRYAPLQPGLHRYTVRARDAYGTVTWGPGSFVALPPRQQGFARVSKTDPRYFEFDTGQPFFPIGHNVRSPSDDRMNKQFPWAKRWTEGSAAYGRHFPAMREHGENFAEIWMAAWSLGIEWSAQWRGYHGIGQYNLMHAWELDRVIDEADRNGIYLNLVLLNHGKFSGRSDNEWQHNPFNRENGGYLEKPEEYFTDPRALKSFQQLMRYIVARWGYSTRIFAWELWSELNLTGSSDKIYRTQECVDWHRLAAAAINAMDPNRHLITTHYSSDYNVQNVEITALAGITHASVDAYHGDPRTLHIVELLQATARFNNPFGKPVLVTEFGGNWDAQGLLHLENSLHAGLWSSTCIPIAGTPLFWWWGLIEEENYYPEYLAINRFMQGEDRRDPNLLGYTPVLTLGGSVNDRIRACSLKSGTGAVAWVYDTVPYNNPNPGAQPTLSNAVARFEGMSNGLYQVEFWGTTEGTRIGARRMKTDAETLTVPLPSFSRDIALKIRIQ